jgi:hypothetical protein
MNKIDLGSIIYWNHPALNKFEYLQKDNTK